MFVNAFSHKGMQIKLYEKFNQKALSKGQSIDIIFLRKLLLEVNNKTFYPCKTLYCCRTCMEKFGGGKVTYRCVMSMMARDIFA